MSENTNLTETIKVRLALDVTYDLNGENATEMVGRLRRMCVNGGVKGSHVAE